LVQATFERHQAVEVDDYGRRRQIKQHDGQHPQHDVRGSEFSRDADPREPDDEQNLREDEIAHAELFPQGRAVRLDLGFGSFELAHAESSVSGIIPDDTET
jgi:hypothetical protein